MVGGAVGFYSGDIRRLGDDLSALKPTMMPAVPRLLNRLYDKAQTEISNSKIKKLLFNMALSAKESELKRYFYLKNCFCFYIYILFTARIKTIANVFIVYFLSFLINYMYPKSKVSFYFNHKIILQKSTIFLVIRFLKI